MEQRTEEWHLARAGCVTASRLSDVMAKTKSGVSQTREGYKKQVLAERLTGTPNETIFINAAMEWGIENEANAKTHYEYLFDVDIKEVGFIKHPDIADFGASPDGFVDDGLIEIKCPNTKTHIDTILTDKIPQKYILQMTGQMLCTRKKWCDFISYDPRLPENMQMYRKRLELDNKLANEIIQAVWEFNSEIKGLIDELAKYQINGKT